MEKPAFPFAVPVPRGNLPKTNNASNAQSVGNKKLRGNTNARNVWPVFIKTDLANRIVFLACRVTINNWLGHRRAKRALKIRRVNNPMPVVVYRVVLGKNPPPAVRNAPRAKRVKRALVSMARVTTAKPVNIAQVA
jgi:hypothetical protein